MFQNFDLTTSSVILIFFLILAPIVFLNERKKEVSRSGEANPLLLMISGFITIFEAAGVVIFGLVLLFSNL